MAVLLVPPYQQFFDDDGNPLAGGKVHTYAAGTTTRKATYTDASGDTPAQNPVELDASGRAVMWGIGSYKFIVTDANDNVIGEPVDNVTTYNIVEAGADSFFQTLSGNGSQTSWTLSEDLGTDPKAIMVFIDSGLQHHEKNGTFDSDTDWTKGSGWTIGSGVATATGAISTSLEQAATVPLIEGQSYTVTYTATRSDGSVTASIGGTAGTARSANGTYTETIVAGASQNITFAGSGFTGTIDNVVVRKTTSIGRQIQDPSTYSINGTQFEIPIPPPAGISNIFVFAPSLLVGAAASAASNAEIFKDAAELSANNAAASETNATTQAGIATTQASISTSKASEANASAILAEYWAEQAAAIANLHASAVIYNNASSGLAATNVQAAIDEIDTAVDSSVAFTAALLSGSRGRILNGIILSNNASDATNDIDISAGSVVSDDGTTVISLSGSLTKRLDSAWAVGSGNGGLDTGSIANTTYHLWAIKRMDTGVCDVLFSASATAPTMPTNYTKKVRIGSVIRAGGTILGFIQYGNTFILKSAVSDVSAGTAGTSSRSTVTTSVPTGIKVEGLYHVGCEWSNSDNSIILLTSLDETDQAATLAFGTNTSGLSATGIRTVSGPFGTVTNTSGQIGVRARNLGSATYNLTTRGWVDYQLNR